MGGFFSAPKPPPDPAEEERQRRLETIERRRRGRAGLIATSARGLLEGALGPAVRKSLLGE